MHQKRAYEHWYHASGGRGSELETAHWQLGHAIRDYEQATLSTDSA